MFKTLGSLPIFKRLFIHLLLLKAHSIFCQKYQIDECSLKHDAFLNIPLLTFIYNVPILFIYLLSEVPDCQKCLETWRDKD